MSEARLKVCPSCSTAIPVQAPVCPECGAGQGPPPSGAGGPGQQVRIEELLGAMEGMFGAAPSPGARNAMTGLALRAFLARYGGCLITVLAVLFGGVLLFGLLFDNVLGALGVLLLVVGGAGLGMTFWIVALLRASKPKQR